MKLTADALKPAPDNFNLRFPAVFCALLCEAKDAPFLPAYPDRFFEWAARLAFVSNQKQGVPASFSFSYFHHRNLKYNKKTPSKDEIAFG